MSTSSTWLGFGALVVLALLASNSIAYRRRYGTWLKSAACSEIRTKRLSWHELVFYLLLTGALVVGVGAPFVAPHSAFAEWLSQPYSLAIYVAWCLIVFVALGVAIAIVKSVRSKR